MRIASIETFSTRDLGPAPRQDRRRRRGLGPGLAVQRRHHRPGRPPPDRAARARPERARHRAPRRPDRRSRAQVPGLLRLARAVRASTPRFGTCAASSRARASASCSAASRARLRVYASSMRRDITPEAEAERLVRPARSPRLRRLQDPHRQRVRPRPDEWPGRTEAIVPAVRKALGDDAALLVDANSCYTPAKAIEVGRMLEDHGVCHFEEPCPYWELEWTKAGRRRARRRRHRRRAGLRAADLAAHDRDARGRRRPARRLLSRRPHPDPARRGDGAGGRPAGHAAFGQPLAGHGLHAAPDGRDRGCRALRRVLDRGRRLLPVAGRASSRRRWWRGTARSRSRTGRAGASRSTRPGSSARPTSRASSTDDAPLRRACVPRELVLFRHNVAGKVETAGRNVSPEQKREDCDD